MVSDTLTSRQISCIIPCKDRPESTKRLLNELCRQKLLYPQTEIIVVENNSIEDMSFLEHYDITLLHTGIGVNHARNVGLDNAHGDYICFIDNDDMIASDYLETLYSYLYTQPGYDWYAYQWYLDDKPITMDRFNVEDPMSYNWALWGYCFSRKIFEGFRFNDDGFAGGDMKIIGQMRKGWHGYFIRELLYRFTWEGNEDSLSHKHNRGEKT